MKHSLLYTLCFLLCSLALNSCRSHKESAVSESSFVEVASTAQVNEKLTNVSDTKLNSAISFDSIEIFIQRNWNSCCSGDKSPSVWLEGPYDKFMATPDSMRISSHSHPSAPYSEIIGIKAYNAKAASSSHSQDSVSALTDSSLAIDLSTESRKEQTGSSNSLAVFDPPDVLKVVVAIFIFFILIYILICFLKRKSNH